MAVLRDSLIVATAELDALLGLVDAKEQVPMAPEEWAAAMQMAVAWMAENPKPKPAA